MVVTGTVDLAEGTSKAIADGNCFDNYGAYIGLFFSSIYIIGSLYYIYSIYYSKEECRDKYYDKYYYITAALFILVGTIDISYFIFSMNNTDKKSMHNIVGHISMIPCYLSIITIFILIGISGAIR